MSTLVLPLRKTGEEKALVAILLEELIVRSEQKWHPKNIYLHVVSSNKKARQLYESLGFRNIARLPQWFEYNTKYLDEYILILDKKRFQQEVKKLVITIVFQGLKKDNHQVSRFSPLQYQQKRFLVSVSQRWYRFSDP